jgi:hypothetical protein
MSTNKARKRNGTRRGRKRRLIEDPNAERLVILRLDLHTIMEQIRILDHEMETDPCLSSEGVSIVLSLIDSLKQELETTRLHIRELKGSTAA